MAKYSTLIMRASMLTILLILLVHVSGMEGSQKSMQPRIDSRAILRGLGYDMPNKVGIKHSNRRSMEDRKAPGGPDPQHNARPPAGN
ncbi:CLAVATA3/ESR (CLE)-related protein [Parasponia andersonii]|uniref:CLAVATA3/ESR (CLE)-related protein n=1 Tax=Parasponia andersonii TaxID=3476 RepID=A0A2P5DX60_PARAD|nr:CLAVATA3/ESR (CLE)-related protein [Parasponia andersonii]